MRIGRASVKAAFWLCLLVAIIGGGRSGYLVAKATLGQHLLEIAWRDAVQSGTISKPWPWADTWPVAHLHVPSLDLSLIVLEGSFGEALAFGPGRVIESSNSAESGVFALGGHRDTHLAWLENIPMNTEFTLSTMDGHTQTYRLTGSVVIDSQRDTLSIAEQAHALVLITCYPFNAAQTGGPLRYVVTAQAVQSSRKG